MSQVVRLFLLAALFFSATALAGGVETPSSAGFYLEGNVGFSFRNWRDDGLFQDYLVSAQGGPVFGSMSNDQNGATAGADLGYQFNDFVALETGWYYLPTLDYTVPLGNTVDVGNTLSIFSWLFYLGGKLMVPIYPNTFVFGKIAVAYITNRASFSGEFSNAVSAVQLPTNGNYWAPLFATGIEYNFRWHWLVNAQYIFVKDFYHTPLGGSPNRIPSPNTNLFTVGIGYKFAI